MMVERPDTESDKRGTLTDEEYKNLQRLTELMKEAPEPTEHEAALAQAMVGGGGGQDDLETAVDRVEQMRAMMPVTREKIKRDFGGVEGKQALGIRGPQGLYWSDPTRDNDAAHVVGGNGLERSISVGNYNNFGGQKRPLWRRWMGSANGWVNATTEEGEAAYSDKRAWRTVRERPAASAADATGARPAAEGDDLDERIRQAEAERARLAALAGGTTGNTDDVKGVKKRARKKVRLDKKAASGDKTLSTTPYDDDERKKIQDNLKDQLNKSNVPDPKKRQEYLDAIEKVTNEAEMAPLRDTLSSLPAREKGNDSDKGGKKDKGADDTKKRRGAKDSDPEPGKRKTRLLSSGVFEIVETDMDGKTTTRLVNAKGETITDTATEDDLWKKAGYGDPTGYKPVAIAEPKQEEKTPFDWNKEVRPTRRPFWRGGWYDWLINRTPAPMSLDAENLLRDEKDPAVRDKLLAMRYITQRENNFKVTANERRVSAQYEKVASKINWRSVGRAALTAVAVGTALSVFGITAPLSIPGLLGMAVGAGTSTAVKEAMEKSGWKRAGLYSFIIGTLAGVGTGAIANSIDNMLTSYFASGTPAPSFPANITPINTIPSPPIGLNPENFGMFQPPVLYGNDSVWASLSDSIKELNKICDLDISRKGSEAFTHAFHKVVEQGHFQGKLLECAGMPLTDIVGQGWRHLPDGTTVRFGRVFSDPAFVDQLMKTISSDYPSLAREIGGGRSGVRDFITKLAFAHAAR